jgi:flagellar hook-associated protein 2
MGEIRLGNTFSAGGRTVIGGSNTGFDTKALVDGLVQAKRLPAVQLEKKIEANAAKQTAYSELSTLLDNFKKASNFLRNPPGVNNDSENIFQYRNSSLSTNTGIAASNYLDSTVSPGADLSTYAITVNNLATYNIKTTNTFALANVNTAVVGPTSEFKSGLLSLGASGTTVSLADGDTLQNVIDKINAKTSTTKVQATAIQVSAGNFRLQLKTTETGAANNYATPGAAMFPNGFAIDQSALDASIVVDGSTITSASNTISNAISNVTFTVKQPTPVGVTVGLEVEADTEIAKTAILNFVDAYNNLKYFNSKQTEIGDDGLALETAVLKNSQALRSTLSSVVNEMSSLVSGLSSPNTLAAIGITFTDFEGDEEIPYTRNTLVVDEDVLDSKLASNFSAVRKIFEFDFNSTNSDVQIFSRNNSLDVSTFSLDINRTAGTYEATYLDNGVITTVSLTGTAISGGGLLLKGNTGTKLDGLQMIYSNTADIVSVINLSQGISDRIYNTLENVTNLTTGSMTIERQSTFDEDKRSNTEITRLDELIEKYRQQLLEKFSTLESALGRINSILNSLDANTNARNNA